MLPLCTSVLLCGCLHCYCDCFRVHWRHLFLHSQLLRLILMVQVVHVSAVRLEFYQRVAPRVVHWSLPFFFLMMVTV